MPVIDRRRDGSYLSTIGTTQVRVITAEIAVATTAGRITTVYRLATTLLDDRRYPAFEIVKLYHRRWEIDLAGVIGAQILASLLTDRRHGSAHEPSNAPYRSTTAAARTSTAPATRPPSASISSRRQPLDKPNPALTERPWGQRGGTRRWARPGEV